MDTTASDTAVSVRFVPPPDDEDDEVLDTKTAAELLGVAERTMRSLARNGRVPAHYYGRGVGWRFSKRSLLAQLQRPFEGEGDHPEA